MVIQQRNNITHSLTHTHMRTHMYIPIAVPSMVFSSATTSVSKLPLIIDAHTSTKSSDGTSTFSSFTSNLVSSRPMVIPTTPMLHLVKKIKSE